MFLLSAGERLLVSMTFRAGFFSILCSVKTALHKKAAHESQSSAAGIAHQWLCSPPGTNQPQSTYPPTHHSERTDSIETRRNLRCTSGCHAVGISTDVDRWVCQISIIQEPIRREENMVSSYDQQYIEKQT